MPANPVDTKVPSIGLVPGSTVGRQMRLPKMAELIAGHLRRQIVRGELAVGESLPSESELMAQFNVSRPTLREAFRILESESLIVVRRGSHGGARVQLPNPDVAAGFMALILQYRGTTLRDLYDARTVVEPACVALVAKNRTKDAISRLRAALDEERVAGDPASSFHAHVAFHSVLIELTGNQTLHMLMSLLKN